MLRTISCRRYCPAVPICWPQAILQCAARSAVTCPSAVNGASTRLGKRTHGYADTHWHYSCIHVDSEVPLCTGATATAQHALSCPGLYGRSPSRRRPRCVRPLRRAAATLASLLGLSRDGLLLAATPKAPLRQAQGWDLFARRVAVVWGASEWASECGDSETDMAALVGMSCGR